LPPEDDGNGITLADYAGFRGEVYTSPAMWRLGNVGVFPSYPFPEGLEQMRMGSS
jgi:hypothetical protein